MPSSSARKERRKKELEGLLSPTPSKVANVENVEDAGEPKSSVVQAGREHGSDVSIVHAEPLSSPTRPAHSTLPGSTCNDSLIVGNPPRILKGSEPALETLYDHPSLQILRNIVLEEQERDRQDVKNHMEAEGFCCSHPESPPIPHAAQSFAPSSSVLQRIGDTVTKEVSEHVEDVLTESRTEHLEKALVDRLATKKHVTLAVPLARHPERPKSPASSVLRAIGGNVDGAAQSFESAISEKDPSREIHTNMPKLERHKDEDEQTKLQLPSQGPTPPTGNLPVLDPITHRNDVTKMMQSPGNGGLDIRPVREVITRGRGKTRRSTSSDYNSSSSANGSKPTISRTRRITHDGILELKASPMKTVSVKTPQMVHRRKVSLKLPINVSKPESPHSPPIIHTPSTTADEDALVLYEAQERELEYIHRHIFIGTASVDDFLEVLEATPVYTTTKRQVVKAFGILACDEQVQARQSSVSSDGWNFVTRTTPDAILTRTDYLTESHVKLGSITLGKFLGKIPFDDQGEVEVPKVIEAFCLVSHLDREATYGGPSKAKAFRSWLVREKASQHDC